MAAPTARWHLARLDVTEQLRFRADGRCRDRNIAKGMLATEVLKELSHRTNKAVLK